MHYRKNSESQLHVTHGRSSVVSDLKNLRPSDRGSCSLNWLEATFRAICQCVTFSCSHSTSSKKYKFRLLKRSRSDAYSTSEKKRAWSAAQAILGEYDLKLMYIDIGSSSIDWIEATFSCSLNWLEVKWTSFQCATFCCSFDWLDLPRT